MCDNLGAVKLVRNPEFHKRTKHIDIKFHFIREKEEDGVIKIDHISTNHQLADLLTKPLPIQRFLYLRDLRMTKEMVKNEGGY